MKKQPAFIPSSGSSLYTFFTFSNIAQGEIGEDLKAIYFTLVQSQQRETERAIFKASTLGAFKWDIFMWISELFRL